MKLASGNPGAVHTMRLIEYGECLHMRLFKKSKFRSLGDSARDRKDWKTAVAQYEKHVARFPEDCAIWIQLGNCMQELGQLSAAGNAYRTALFRRPYDADLYLQIGRLHRAEGAMGQAISAWRRAHELDPSSPARQELSALGELPPPPPEAEDVEILRKALKRLEGRVALLEQRLLELDRGEYENLVR